VQPTVLEAPFGAVSSGFLKLSALTLEISDTPEGRSVLHSCSLKTLPRSKYHDVTAGLNLDLSPDTDDDWELFKNIRAGTVKTLLLQLTAQTASNPNSAASSEGPTYTSQGLVLVLDADAGQYSYWRRIGFFRQPDDSAKILPFLRREIIII